MTKQSDSGQRLEQDKWAQTGASVKYSVKECINALSLIKKHYLFIGLEKTLLNPIVDIKMIH